VQPAVRVFPIAHVNPPMSVTLPLNPLPGKEQPVEVSLARFEHTLARLGIEVVFSGVQEAVPGLHACHVAVAGCPVLFANGKGASAAAARASALGELIERLATGYLWTDFALEGSSPGAGPLLAADEVWLKPEALDRVLDRALRQRLQLDPELDAEMLHDAHTLRDEVLCLPLRHASTGETRLWPWNLLSNLYASNGLAAGNSLAEALVQATSEILERAIKFRVLREGLCLPQVPEARLAELPHLLKARAALQAHGVRIWFVDASLGGRYPVAAVHAISADTGAVVSSFGAHPCFRVALERACTELLQGRQIADLHGLPSASPDLEACASAENLELHFIDQSGLIPLASLGDPPDFPFTPWGMPAVADTGASERQFAQLVQRLAEEGHALWWREEWLGDVPACRVVVPGLSEIYPSDDLLERNTNAARALRTAVLNIHRLPPPDLQRALAGLEQGPWGLLEPVGSAALLATAASRWHGMRLLELKARLELALGEFDAAAQSVQDLLELHRHDSLLEGERAAAWRLLATQLQTHLTGRSYLALGESLAPEERHPQAAAWAGLWLNGQAFADLPDLGGQPASLPAHAAVLHTHARVLADKLSRAGQP